MGAWNSRGLRGSMLEEAVNFTNQKYSQEKSGSCAENTDTHNADRN